MRWLMWLTGGRPMRFEREGFRDVVSGKMVCYYVDWFGRKWMADSGAWSWFRVERIL